MKLATHAVLSVTTGRLLGDIGGVYKVISFLVGRSVFTHELSLYGRQAAVAILAVFPELPTEKSCNGMNGSNYQGYRLKWEKQFGVEIDLPDTLRDCLADDKSPHETARMLGVPQHKIIMVRK